MQLGVCLNCKHHEDCTFQRVFPVRECSEYEEMDLGAELDKNLTDVLAGWGFLAREEKKE